MLKKAILKNVVIPMDMHIKVTWQHLLQQQKHKVGVLMSMLRTNNIIGIAITIIRIRNMVRIENIRLGVVKPLLFKKKFLIIVYIPSPSIKSWEAQNKKYALDFACTCCCIYAKINKTETNDNKAAIIGVNMT